MRTLEGPRTACPFRYQGQYEDAETGLYYNRFRYYDPTAGQYLSQDPIGLAGGLAAYAYVPDPNSWLDPFGLAKCGADDGFRKGWDKERVLKRPKFKRAKTERYLKKRFTDNHLAQFHGEASYLMTGDAYRDWALGKPYIGRADGQFISTKLDIDGVLSRSNGDVALLEKELGIPAGKDGWQNKGGIVRLDVQNPENFNLRMASGNEPGANSLWEPGGFVPGGSPEAVIDSFPAASVIVKKVIP